MQLPILCYHKVGLIAEEGRRLNIEPSRLATHVRFAARRYRVVLARDLARPWTSKTIAFTFDDAYTSTMTHGVEVLERHGVQASFYAVSSLVGATSGWDGELARPLADWPLLLRAQEKGHEIGNHSRSHPRLAECEDPAAEIDDAHAELTAKGIRCDSVCYPYGSWNERVREAAGRYPVGLALGKRPAQATDDLRALPRIVVACSDTLPMLLYKIHLKPRLRRG